MKAWSDNDEWSKALDELQARRDEIRKIAKKAVEHLDELPIVEICCEEWHIQCLIEKVLIFEDENKRLKSDIDEILTALENNNKRLVEILSD